MIARQQFPRIPLDELRPGMFVVEIFDAGGPARLAQPGLVKTAAIISELKRRGITEVCFDPERSMNAGHAGPAARESGAESAGVSADATTVRIQGLHQEAQSLQEKFLDQVRRGEAIDIEPLAEVAEEMVDTMFRHGDAMLCLARIRAKDAYLMEHSMNVAILLANFGRHLGMDRNILKELTMGGLLHDVGKVMTPDEILHKPEKLTEDEFCVMRQHAVHSRLILRATEGITDVMVDVAANHHERMDGGGYPRGLKADELSVYSRMSSIVDVYDALTAERVYKKGMQCTQAFRILLEGAGSQFDKDLVGQFIKCMTVYPPGTLVQLTNQRLAVVLQRNRKAPLKPLVKIIYHAGRRHYEDVTLLDLSKPTVTVSIEKAVDPLQFGIDLERFL